MDHSDLDEIATAALDGANTDACFLEHRELFVEIAALWIQDGSNSDAKIAAFGRILPFAPHLLEHAQRFLETTNQSYILSACSLSHSRSPLQHFTPHGRDGSDSLLAVLQGAFRLLSHDRRAFSKYIRASAFGPLFNHDRPDIRYMAVRLFSLYVHAADYATEELRKRYVGVAGIDGQWEGLSIDFRLFSLWEAKRWSEMSQKVQAAADEISILSKSDLKLSPYTVNIHGVLLPRLDGASSQERPAELVPTSTTESNLKQIAFGLLQQGPLLLTGLAGAGKTLLVRHFAYKLNKLDTMVTLHLNEQSDAKLLVGMYATGAKPGTFIWKAGVLTTAVREGRWIFIEDLDRAPNEVISTLLPLIERGELTIPSRGETIRAARGFRIISTMRTTLSPRGQEIIPRQNMIGHRFWQSIAVKMPELQEFETIVSATYPSLKGHIPGIMNVYSRLMHLYADPKFSSENGTSLRALTPRDLLKWCDRIAVLLSQSSTFSTAQVDDIFMEARDCFAGSLPSEKARFKVMACVAEELHIDPQRRDHLLVNREVKLDMPKTNSAGVIRIGRARLSKHKSSRRQPSGRPFSTNDYTLRLLEKVAVAVDRKEPFLLVGETGTGKTTCIQYLAEQLGRKLVAFNLSQQSESGDLLGGYKPVNVRSLVIPLKDEFDDLFDTTFSRKKNQRFVEMLGKRVAKGEWKRVCVLWREALKMVDNARKASESRISSPDPDGEQPKKKRKVDGLPANFPNARWQKFAADVHDLEAQLTSGSDAFAFSFLEGNIVKAVRNGDWVLLDEINLASSDTLEALVDLLGGGPDGAPSLLLTETGNVERVVAHPNFRVFAAMNPATDIGKKDLPPGIRSRFTELYVESPDSDVKSLRSIVEKYLGGDSNDAALKKTALEVTNLYLDIQKLAKSNMLVDGADQKAHFSLRTLTRTLSYAREIAPLCTLRRALYEGFHMSFLTFLGKASEDLVAPLIKEHLFSGKASTKSELGRPLQQPGDGRSYVKHNHYWLRRGKHAVEEQTHYIITPFVQRNMNNLIRAASTRRYPVLIQGPTSSGKTSMIEYLAKRSGNKFVRINNHEHTDLQEYLGSYISGADGNLIFQEGILVRALREGHWIVLDELNLAPTDVLEALNRLLDDNRELLIPETQEVVRPHDDFMLFATQNPAGLYGGRKVLSRAFRNRFLELHFDDIPVEELTEILHRRTLIPESWCKRIVKVYQELSTLRQENRLFEQKSFATLRDLFRWAQRKADTVQDLANNGYMLLAERVRKEEERQAVKKIIENVMSKAGPRIQINEELMYSSETSPDIRLCNEKYPEDGSVVWTRAMRRLYVLVAQALRNNEPVLLVGETGCGKTTVCQMLADALEKQLHIVNAHQNTETGDLIGAQRPIRNRAAIEDLLRQQLCSILNIPSAAIADLPQLLQTYDQLPSTTRSAIPEEIQDEIRTHRVKAAALFEWADGSLVHAMKTGQLFLLDEISLADDSVLERLNSVLESSRTMLLAEKGPIDSTVVATEGFQFLATMNPGGDYGKKELSPALRNRFTEIWVPALSDVQDVLQIVRSKLKPSITQHAGVLVSFAQFFNEKYNTSVSSSISIRDTLAWVTFINQTEDPILGIVHGAAMVFIDTLGANPAGLLSIPASSIAGERRACLQRLTELLDRDVTGAYFGDVEIQTTPSTLQIGSFSVVRHETTAEDPTFSLEAPTTRSNAMRVIRALQLSKPILLEGNPGVGKTTLVTAIARAVGKPLTRLNLSEQTDLMDLFGSDVPVEGGQAGTFAWRDAPFLKAMKNGDWVLLDEMNLASQSVLEGLNAVLDHRGAVYISELDQTFEKHPNFRVFAAQNPHHQGGGRKGLPASFVNRFTVVYADVFQPEDLLLICAKIFPNIDRDEAERLIRFVAALDEQVVDRRTFGALGSPWEFNLRDTLRWLRLLGAEGSARDFLDAIFVQRFRSEQDRDRLLKLFADVYGGHDARMSLYHNVGDRSIQVGLGQLPRDLILARPDQVFPLRIPQLSAMEALMISVKQNWPVILVGPPSSGKTALINQLASFVGADLTTFSMNADIDAMDLVGGYEQVDPSRDIHRFKTRLEGYVRQQLIASDSTSETLLGILSYLLTRSDILTEHFRSIICSLAANQTTESAQLLQDYEAISNIPQQIEGARFQWVDGLLIRALESGQWLVLDNANLCSSAVLDRLNSLLEPNGYLSINEHSTADGEARIVHPHPNFRIFLTMDPRFGELSRAMRNRAVEICLLHADEQGDKLPKTPHYPTDSSVYRIRNMTGSNHDLAADAAIHLEHLALGDVDLSPFTTSNAPTLLPLSAHETSQALILPDEPAYNVITRSAHFAQWLHQLPQPSTCSLLPRSAKTDVVFHPLTNELYLQQSTQFAFLSVQAAAYYELYWEAHSMRKAIESLPSARFDRRSEKQHLPAFLLKFWQALGQCAKSMWNELQAGATNDLAIIKGLRVLFWALTDLAKSQTFDRATFQTLLKMLKSELAIVEKTRLPALVGLSDAISKDLSVFGQAVHLKTGLGMELIWEKFRPATPTSLSQLNAIISLERLADRLDAAMWRSRLVLDEMVQIRERFGSALQIAKERDVDAAELVLNLESAVKELEDSIEEEDTVVTPYFEDEFEGLCQYADAPRRADDRRKISEPSTKAKCALFARRSTKSSHTAASTSSAQILGSLYQFTGLDRQSSREMVLQDRFHVATLDKLHNADEVPLAHLDRFESELQVFSQHISLASSSIWQGYQNHLADAHFDLVNALCQSHGNIVSATREWHNDTPTNQFAQVGISFPETVVEAHRRLLEGPWKTCMDHHADASSSDKAMVATAWVTYALAGLALYVPNYPHDPALRPMIDRRLFNEQWTALNQKISDLRSYQISFTGQTTSFRIREIEKKVERMGTEPPVPAIVRPKSSELDALQGEFTNLLGTIQPLLDHKMSIATASQDKTLRQNILRIIERLVDGYRSYDDITGPAVGFLTCLNIGLSLGSQAQLDETSISKSLDYLTRETPFFGGSGAVTPHAATHLVQGYEQELAQQGRHAVDLRWHALHSLVLIRAVHQGQLSDEAARNLISNLFSSLYTEWKQKLLHDQEKEARNTSLYTYKGDEEDLDEEDPELFPDYEKEYENQPPQSSTATSRDHAIELSDIHAELFTDTSSSSAALRQLLEWSSSQMVRVANGQAHGTQTGNTLPAIFAALAKKADALASSGVGRAYNFYFDANVPEAKRLITLVHRIQTRYRQLRKLWPEHATLSDVLRTCDEALEFRHVDPVAKFITKAEKLHGYIYEWDRVASKELSTASLYDELTKLLVGWRQLELTTWARLFEIETEKCRDNAKSWFFIAYETIIAASESIEDPKEMRVHVKNLLRTLETFFSSTTLGQFEQRIKLLEQFREHLRMRLQDQTIFRPVHLALSNFIVYFARLRKPVVDALAKGRQNLEKQVGDVIKLASWKDTNIEALKQSAKASHRKLSRLVKKFRVLLNQPVSGILRAGFPEQGVDLHPATLPEVSIQSDAALLNWLDSSVVKLSAWAERPTRFKNIATTVSLMHKLSSPSVEAVSGAKYIDSFIDDLEMSITRLRKATPSTLTEDNKQTVQHLKTQKRKLYADTMKELRQMGIQSNLSSDVLARQDELSTVLARLPQVETDAEHYLHKALNGMDQVRAVSKEHSGDLTPNDVAKSIGYLEGLLHAAIRQRGMLANLGGAAEDLRMRSGQIANVCMRYNELTTVSKSTCEESKSLHASIAWLAAILKTGAEIAAAQARLGKTNEFDVVVRGLNEWSTIFSGLASGFDKLPQLPRFVWSEECVKWDESARLRLNEFNSIFEKWLQEYSMPGAVLQQIKPYLVDASCAIPTLSATHTDTTLESNSHAVISVLDNILATFQRVEEALKDIPASTDDANWLLKEESVLADAISAFDTVKVASMLGKILHEMWGSGSDEGVRAVGAMFAALKPIIDQYLASHLYLTQKLDNLHIVTSKLLDRLSKTFVQIGTQGFCTPSEKSDEQGGKDDKLESGTGLGEGEGAEDISKDIEDDEDLEDLAQEKGEEREGSIEEEDDAVDMGDQEMEGEMNDMEEKEDQDGEEGEDGEEDAESQVGSVDDLGANTLDEKMWDEGGKEDDSKEMEGKQDVGTEDQDEQVAAEEKQKKEDAGEKGEEKEEKEGGSEDEEMEGEDQDENVGVNETEKMDPHAKEEETLDLPEELDLEGNEDDKDDDELGDMDMGDDENLENGEDMDMEDTAEPDPVADEVGEGEQGEDEKETTDHIKDEDALDEQEGEEPVDDEEEAIPLPEEQTQPDDARDTKDNEADPNAEAGAGTDANEEAHQKQDNQASASAANREEGKEGESSENKQESTSEEGALGQTAQPDAGGRSEENEESPETQSFKKLGDVLEKWYNQQRQIQNSREKDESQVQQIDQEVNMADAEFEHLPDEETQSDTQALGTATEEQAKALDQDMAMAVDEEDKVAARPEDQEEQGAEHAEEDAQMEDADVRQDQDDSEQPQTADGRPQAFVGEQKTFDHDADQDMADGNVQEDDDDDNASETSSVQDVRSQFDLTHLDPSTLPSPETARNLWLQHEASTHSLSQQLTEHLRLILAPTLATKLRGDFRTGKRLNLKRIIPYIASGYKRDKIWLRRSMPSKRNYQVLIALDDSKSMAESSASNLALKTLTLVTRSLAMLEVGEVAVVGFGDDVNVAHDFDKPFTSEAGVRVFEQFGFGASKTNVRGLVDRSLDLFADARRKGSSSVGEDLWQLMLVVSDGICDEHGEITRLVRRAQEERVMIVFIIIDATATAPLTSNPSEPTTSSSGAPPPPQKEKTSILDLQSVEISQEGKVVRWKYMERFPFRYYLVVRDVRELPGVLAGALRQWFGEVAGSV